MFDVTPLSTFGKARCRQCLKEHDQVVRSHDYWSLVERFGNHCNSCHAPQAEPMRPHIRFCIDVNHQRMTVRGLLCKKCNVGIGMVDDDPQRLLMLALYLMRNQ
jgi:hypothetical protein